MTANDLSNAADLACFYALQESDRPLSAQYWDERAARWSHARAGRQKDDSRVESAVDFLARRGLLQPDFAVADIGCGPGRFAAAFGARVHRVEGFDLSARMIDLGRAHVREQGLTNVTLHACDSAALDLDAAGYRGAFDLVFSSMTPAIRGRDALEKSMAMSRAWCCNITHLSGRNHLHARLLREVFGTDYRAPWSGRWFYSLFNVLFLLGYAPETSYENRHQELLICPDGEYVSYLMAHALPAEARTAANGEKIRRWLHTQENEDGLVREVIDTTYGRTLWDVRARTARPDLRDRGRL